MAEEPANSPSDAPDVAPAPSTPPRDGAFWFKALAGGIALGWIGALAAPMLDILAFLVLLPLALIGAIDVDQIESTFVSSHLAPAVVLLVVGVASTLATRARAILPIALFVGGVIAWVVLVRAV